MGVVLTEVLMRTIPFNSTRKVPFEVVPGYYFIPRFEAGWWWKFKVAHPQWFDVARKYKSYRHPCCCPAGTIDTCPEFHSMDDLVDWLSETLSLPKGVTNLLRIEAHNEGAKALRRYVDERLSNNIWFRRYG